MLVWLGTSYKTKMQASADIQFILSQDQSIREAGLHINSLKIHYLVYKGLHPSELFARLPKSPKSLHLIVPSRLTLFS